MISTFKSNSPKKILYGIFNKDYMPRKAKTIFTNAVTRLDEAISAFQQNKRTEAKNKLEAARAHMNDLTGDEQLEYLDWWPNLERYLFHIEPKSWGKNKELKNVKKMCEIIMKEDRPNSAEKKFNEKDYVTLQGHSL